MVSFDMIWYICMAFDTLWYDIVLFELYYMIWFGTDLYMFGVVWFGTVWYDMAWYRSLIV